MKDRSVSENERKRMDSLNCFRFFLTFGFLLLITLTTTKINNKTKELQNIQENWNRGPFMRITAQRQGKEEQIFVGEWPGTTTGCNCLGIRYCYRRGVLPNSLTRGSCGFNETYCGCKTVAATPKQSLLIFPYQIEFFGERDNDLAFAKIYNNMETSGKCKQGFKKCGEEKAPFYGVCIPEGKNCPITDIRFAINNTDPSSYSEIKGKKLNLFYTNKNINSPLTELTVSEFKMCADLERSITPSRESYVLYETPGVDCVSDDRYQYLGESTGEKEYLDANRVNYLGLPSFKTAYHYGYKKFGRNLIKIKPECFGSVPELIHPNGDHKKIDSTARILRYFSIIIIIITFSSVIAFICCFKNIYLFKYIKYLKINTLIYYITLFILIGLIVFNIVLLKSSGGTIKELIKKSCFENFTLDRMKVLSEEFSGGLFIWMIISLILYLILFGVDFYIMKKEFFVLKIPIEDEGISDIEGLNKGADFRTEIPTQNNYNNNQYGQHGGYGHQNQFPQQQGNYYGGNNGGYNHY